GRLAGAAEPRDLRAARPRGEDGGRRSRADRRRGRDRARPRPRRRRRTGRHRLRGTVALAGALDGGDAPTAVDRAAPAAGLRSYAVPEVAGSPWGRARSGCDGVSSAWRQLIAAPGRGGNVSTATGPEAAPGSSTTGSPGSPVTSASSRIAALTCASSVTGPAAGSSRRVWRTAPPSAAEPSADEPHAEDPSAARPRVKRTPSGGIRTA